jgi:hypothetical protein
MCVCARYHLSMMQRVVPVSLVAEPSVMKFTGFSPTSNPSCVMSASLASLPKYFCAWLRICAGVRVLIQEATFFHSRPYNWRPSRKHSCSSSVQRPPFMPACFWAILDKAICLCNGDDDSTTIDIYHHESIDVTGIYPPLWLRHRTAWTSTYPWYFPRGNNAPRQHEQVMNERHKRGSSQNRSPRSLPRLDMSQLRAVCRRERCVGVVFEICISMGSRKWADNISGMCNSM